MKTIRPSIEIVDEIDGIKTCKKIEKIARVCYNSEDKITDTSYEGFLKGVIKRGHESVLEHENITVKIITDRAIALEIVRHRIASYTMRSTRYVDESNLSVVVPYEIADATDSKWSEWYLGCEDAEEHYRALLSLGVSKQTARGVLPNNTATILYLTTNIREWRHIFKLRTDITAHPDIRWVMKDILKEFKSRIPVLFDDIQIKD